MVARFVDGNVPALWRKATLPLSVFVIAVMLLASTKGSGLPAKQGWGLLSLEIVVISLAVVYWEFEHRRVSPGEVAVMATLGSVAAVSRVIFAPLPNVQPVTFIVIISGLVFGPRAGFMVGSTAALVSNFFLGQGPWTPWQMFAWGLAGTSAGAVSAVLPRVGVLGMTACAFVWGYLFGWIMDFWFWATFISPLNLHSLAATMAASFWFDTLHAWGNAAFCTLLGPGFFRILRRFRRRLEVTHITIDSLGATGGTGGPGKTRKS